MNWILGAVAAFLIGSLPWGLWTGRLVRGIDVRRHGSGNLGATNVYRVLGPGWGITVLLLDAAKGVAAVLLARQLCGGDGGAWGGLVGLAGSVLGHSFSPFAGFRGGKGVATAAGAWGALAPAALGCALAAWTVFFAATRIVSAASMAASVVLPVAVGLLRQRGQAAARDPIFWLAVLTAILLLLRHRSNLERLLHGREKPLALRGPAREPRTGGEGR